MKTKNSFAASFSTSFKALAWSFVLGILFIPGLVISLVLLPWLPLIARGADALTRAASAWAGRAVPPREANRWFDVRQAGNLVVQLLIGFVSFTVWLGGGITVGILYAAPFLVDELQFGAWAVADPVQKVAISWALATIALAVTVALTVGAGLLSLWLAGMILAPSAEDLARSRAVIIDSFSGERRRIERELHDGPQQHLTALKLNVAAARIAKEPEDLKAALDAADKNASDALAQLRGVVRGIAPQVLYDNGLVAAVEELIAHSGLDVTLQRGGGDIGPLDETTALLAYHCVAEGLTNATRHGGADKIEVSIAANELAPAMVSPLRTLTVRVKDNGRGLGGSRGAGGEGVDKQGSGTGGTGIAGLRERAAALGGTVSLSDVAGGAQLRMDLPIHPAT
nr:histidine kinase [Corynebacterium lactis]